MLIKKFKYTLFKPSNILPLARKYYCSDSNQDTYFEKLSSENEKGIYVLNFNKQSNRNALSESFISSMNDNLTKLSTFKDLQVLILASKVQGIFCAGADLKERLKMKEEDIDGFVYRLRSLALKIHKFRKPTIAALDGVALGGGLEMALACDIRICSTDSKLGLVETKLAIFPGAGGTQFLPRIIGPAKAKELIFSASILNGEEAEKIGLVNQTHLQNENKNAAFLNSINLAKKIIPNGPIALEFAKKSINTGLNYELEKGLEIERNFYKNIISTKDRIEGLKSFVEKRKPIYKGE